MTFLKPLVGKSLRSGVAALALFSSAVFAIDPPANPRGTEIADRSVQWEWDPVDGAMEYEITVDGINVGRSTNLYHVTNNLWNGDHSLTVRAVGFDGQMSEQSQTAKMVVRDRFDPAVLNRSEIVRIGHASTDVDTATDTPATPVEAAPEPAPAPAPAPEPAPAPVVSADDNGLVDPVSWSIPEATQRPGYELVFSDEFNGGSLNPARWNSQLRWDGDFNGERFEYRVINGEDQFYVNPLSQDPEHLGSIVPVYNPFQFDGNRLAIRAIRNPLQQNPGNRSYGRMTDIASQQTFLSGALSTHDKFFQRYGYFEARIKIPSHEGTFPAFWLYHQTRRFDGVTQRTEIDIMENLGHAPWFIYNSFHFNTNVSASYGGDHNFVKPFPEGQIFTGTDYSQDYHTYGVEWEPGRVTWFIDGQQVSYLENSNVDFEELYLIINLAIGGNWNSFPTSAGGIGREWPNQSDIDNWGNPALEIDYVRVYQRR